MVVLGATDALVRQPFPRASWQALFSPKPVVAVTGTEPAKVPTSGGVRKQSGPDVRETSKRLGFELLETGESSLLAQIVTEAPVQSLVLLSGGDRAGSVTWVQSAKVKTYLTTLKDALHQSLSADVRDLRDETQERPGTPVRNYLTFLDPNLSQERVVFVRVRELLLEFHLAPGHEPALFQLIDQLSL